ncbi:hypothetical protein K9N08_03875 [Candidatus Gracilibacteria bacterium]|nr:hypothetical protein [Candidatus Gracilibacteria bacterium]MCF7856660.1 hypothetical protein [Candidatus Gracilibacteria bacterium]MCF7896991.1 hypothetical protein [Candidatus Gracilibacteria bacterium]
MGSQLGQLAPAKGLAIYAGNYVSLNSRDCLKDGVLDLTELTRGLVAFLHDAFGNKVLPKLESKQEQNSEQE